MLTSRYFKTKCNSFTSLNIVIISFLKCLKKEIKAQAKNIVELLKSLEIAIEELNKMEVSIKTS